MANFSKNPFALLDDDDAPAPVVAPKGPKAATATPAPSSGIAQATQRNVPGRGDNANRRGGRGDFRGANRGTFNREGGPRPPRNQDSAAVDDGFSPAGRDDRAERTRGRGGSGPRGGGGRGGPRGRGRGGFARPDRHSATGIHDSEKKEVQGWGGDDAKRELEAEDEGARDAAGEAKTGDATPDPATGAWGDDAAPADGEKPSGWEATAGEGAAATTTGEGAKANGAPAEEEVDNTLTFEQYLASQSGQASVAGFEAKQAREANAGQDDSQWKDAVALARKGDQDDEAYFAATKAKAQRQRQQKEGKTLLEVNTHFARPRPDREGTRGGARGRGEGRGRGGPRGEGRGAPRGGPRQSGPRSGAGPRTANFNADDMSAFPSLS